MCAPVCACACVSVCNARLSKSYVSEAQEANEPIQTHIHSLGREPFLCAILHSFSSCVDARVCTPCDQEILNVYIYCSVFAPIEFHTYSCQSCLCDVCVCMYVMLCRASTVYNIYGNKILAYFRRNDRSYAYSMVKCISAF